MTQTFIPHFYVNGCNLYVWDADVTLLIGKFCSIGDKVTIIAGGEHPKGWVSYVSFQKALFQH
jgi:hypothetical protein